MTISLSIASREAGDESTGVYLRRDSESVTYALKAKLI